VSDAAIDVTSAEFEPVAVVKNAEKIG